MASATEKLVLTALHLALSNRVQCLNTALFGIRMKNAEKSFPDMLENSTYCNELDNMFNNEMITRQRYESEGTRIMMFDETNNETHHDIISTQDEIRLSSGLKKENGNSSDDLNLYADAFYIGCALAVVEMLIVLACLMIKQEELKKTRDAIAQTCVHVNGVPGEVECHWRKSTEGDDKDECKSEDDEPHLQSIDHITTSGEKCEDTVCVVRKRAGVDTSQSDLSNGLKSTKEEWEEGNELDESQNRDHDPCSNKNTTRGSDSTYGGKCEDTIYVIPKTVGIDASLSDADYGTTGQEDDEMLCKICFNEYISVVFLPCSHMIACECCSNVLRKCAVCRSVIKGTLKARVQ